MRYELALEIHERNEEVLRLIKTGEHSTAALAESLGVCKPTISIIIAAPREQAHEVRGRRISTGYRHVLTQFRGSTSSHDGANFQSGKKACCNAL